ncbi:hypothetical protein PAERUG_P37_London_28_VIM_2_07_12_00003 [Pseudomonas aeruginosa]|nr:hypothetical protein PAERUG_P37_London_28_VIM_2_07_12_00003 [Pseudomonas aeruginosa]CRN54575.1 hypothetical protein PAERUG_E12_London_26_VIM_2_06_13_00792 [Pseudomonas aeruginosa]CRN69639.1 hypothetical protein PAERUG_E11_London_26_VIM_2_06_13_00244 [Pseudomonas aeruginosa]CRP38772.1 hypothetical protein PAERUG_P2_London_28_IMP_1_06_05_02677 [Pseudomonas aeruginosa]CRQ27604.1 hypothetical protein PAERUG_P44_Wales_1_VIM_2_11_12_00615 [Pseudomonas aeruginosa]
MREQTSCQASAQRLTTTERLAATQDLGALRSAVQQHPPSRRRRLDNADLSLFDEGQQRLRILALLSLRHDDTGTAGQAQV